MAEPAPYSNMTPTDVEQRRRLAARLMQQGSDAAPVEHWTQGLARVLQGGMGGYYGRTASDAEKEGIASRGAFMAEAMKNPQAAAASGASNPWTTEQASQIGQKVIGQKIEQADPRFQMDLKLKQSQLAGHGLQQQLTQAQLAQIKTQTPEWRMQFASRIGLAAGTPEFNAFVVSGQYAPKADTFDLEEGKTRYQQIRQPDGSYKVAPVVSAPAKMDSQAKKELAEADDFIGQTQAAIGALKEAQRLNSTAYDGLAASQRAGAMNATSMLSTPESQATANLQNVVTNQALQSLRATFGGNPTEGERKILLEVAGSVNQPAAVRAEIYNRALALAQQRLAINQQKAEALRGGTYYGQGGQPPAINQPVDLTPQADRPPVRLNSSAEYEALPSGTPYVAPDGKTRIKR